LERQKDEGRRQKGDIGEGLRVSR